MVKELLITDFCELIVIILTLLLNSKLILLKGNRLNKDRILSNFEFTIREK